MTPRAPGPYTRSMAQTPRHQNPAAVDEQPFQFSLMTALYAMFAASIALYLHVCCDRIVCTFWDSTVIFAASLLWLNRTSTYKKMEYDFFVMLITMISGFACMATAPHVVGVVVERVLGWR
jgi:hypothetical protein